MPEVVAAYKKYESKGFKVLGISVDNADKLPKIQEILQEQKVTFPNIYDAKGSAGPLVGLNAVRGFPTSFLLDRSGRCRYINNYGEDLDHRIQELLAEPAAK